MKKIALPFLVLTGHLGYGQIIDDLDALDALGDEMSVQGGSSSDGSTGDDDFLDMLTDDDISQLDLPSAPEQTKAAKQAAPRPETDEEFLELFREEDTDGLDLPEQPPSRPSQRRRRADKKEAEEKKTASPEVAIVPKIFDVGTEEKRLLELARHVEGKIAAGEWNEIATAAKIDRYVVQKGDWLWKISQRFFGSGFYYSKIWSLNPQITNPHEIEPGMVLLFNTGDSDGMPDVELGTFREQRASEEGVDYAQFGENTRPPWLDEREKLIKDGVYFQYSSANTYEDLARIGQLSLKDDYKHYNPVTPPSLMRRAPQKEEIGTWTKIFSERGSLNQGFYLNTFVTDDVMKELGSIDSFSRENSYAQNFETVYTKFNPSLDVSPGDMFSAYEYHGILKHKVSDRAGHRYSVIGQIKVLGRKDELWECEVLDVSNFLARGTKITTHIPKISKIIKTFSPRAIEAAIIGSYLGNQMVSFGDVIYIDRGRNDGVDLGTVFSIYDFFDRGTKKRITPNPTYKIGEMAVINLTDNFATALISHSSNDIRIGHLAFSKSQREAKESLEKQKLGKLLKSESEALDNLDVELKVDSLSEDILSEADKNRPTKEELEELTRLEREKTELTEHERDLRELERLEQEVGDAEKSLGEVKVDEDKFLEQQNLDNIERRADKSPDAFKNIDEIEKDIGRKYADENLNSKENPYGLTEFDLEEVDELLNTESL